MMQLSPAAGSILHLLARSECVVTLVILTKGERGTPDATLDPGLKDRRTREVQTLAALPGITTYIQEDVGEGELHAKVRELPVVVAATIERENPICSSSTTLLASMATQTIA